MHMKNLPSQRDTDDEKRQKKEEAAVLEAAYLWHKDRLDAYELHAHKVHTHEVHACEVSRS
jgi:hypothetical protein